MGRVAWSGVEWSGVGMGWGFSGVAWRGVGMESSGVGVNSGAG